MTKKRAETTAAEEWRTQPTYGLAVEVNTVEQLHTVSAMHGKAVSITSNELPHSHAVAKAQRVVGRANGIRRLSVENSQIARTIVVCSASARESTMLRSLNFRRFQWVQPHQSDTGGNVKAFINHFAQENAFAGLYNAYTRKTVYRTADDEVQHSFHWSRFEDYLPEAPSEIDATWSVNCAEYVPSTFYGRYPSHCKHYQLVIIPKQARAWLAMVRAGSMHFAGTSTYSVYDEEAGARVSLLCDRTGSKDPADYTVCWMPCNDAEAIGREYKFPLNKIAEYLTPVFVSGGQRWRRELEYYGGGVALSIVCATGEPLENMVVPLICLPDLRQRTYGKYVALPEDVWHKVMRSVATDLTRSGDTITAARTVALTRTALDEEMRLVCPVPTEMMVVLVFWLAFRHLQETEDYQRMMERKKQGGLRRFLAKHLVRPFEKMYDCVIPWRNVQTRAVEAMHTNRLPYTASVGPHVVRVDVTTGVRWFGRDWVLVEDTTSGSCVQYVKDQFCFGNAAETPCGGHAEYIDNCYACQFETLRELGKRPGCVFITEQMEVCDIKPTTSAIIVAGDGHAYMYRRRFNIKLFARDDAMPTAKPERYHLAIERKAEWRPFKGKYLRLDTDQIGEYVHDRKYLAKFGVPTAFVAEDNMMATMYVLALMRTKGMHRCLLKGVNEEAAHRFGMTHGVRLTMAGDIAQSTHGLHYARDIDEFGYDCIVDFSDDASLRDKARREHIALFTLCDSRKAVTDRCSLHPVPFSHTTTIGCFEQRVSHDYRVMSCAPEVNEHAHLRATGWDRWAMKTIDNAVGGAIQKALAAERPARTSYAIEADGHDTADESAEEPFAEPFEDGGTFCSDATSEATADEPGPSRVLPKANIIHEERADGTLVPAHVHARVRELIGTKDDTQREIATRCERGLYKLEHEYLRLRFDKNELQGMPGNAKYLRMYLTFLCVLLNDPHAVRVGGDGTVDYHGDRDAMITVLTEWIESCFEMIAANGAFREVRGERVPNLWHEILLEIYPDLQVIGERIRKTNPKAAATAKVDELLQKGVRVHSYGVFGAVGAAKSSASLLQAFARYEETDDDSMHMLGQMIDVPVLTEMRKNSDEISEKVPCGQYHTVYTRDGNPEQVPCQHAHSKTWELFAHGNEINHFVCDETFRLGAVKTILLALLRAPAESSVLISINGEERQCGAYSNSETNKHQLFTNAVALMSDTSHAHCECIAKKISLDRGREMHGVGKCGTTVVVHKRFNVRQYEQARVEGVVISNMKRDHQVNAPGTQGLRAKRLLTLQRRCNTQMFDPSDGGTKMNPHIYTMNGRIKCGPESTWHIMPAAGESVNELLRTMPEAWRNIVQKTKGDVVSFCPCELEVMQAGVAPMRGVLPVEHGTVVLDPVHTPDRVGVDIHKLDFDPVTDAHRHSKVSTRKAINPAHREQLAPAGDVFAIPKGAHQKADNTLCGDGPKRGHIFDTVECQQLEAIMQVEGQRIKASLDSGLPKLTRGPLLDQIDESRRRAEELGLQVRMNAAAFERVTKEAQRVFAFGTSDAIKQSASDQLYEVDTALQRLVADNYKQRVKEGKVPPAYTLDEDQQRALGILIVREFGNPRCDLHDPVNIDYYLKIVALAIQHKNSIKQCTMSEYLRQFGSTQIDEIVEKVRSEDPEYDARDLREVLESMDRGEEGLSQGRDLENMDPDRIWQDLHVMVTKTQTKLKELGLEGKVKGGQPVISGNAERAYLDVVDRMLWRLLPIIVANTFNEESAFPFFQSAVTGSSPVIALERLRQHNDAQACPGSFGGDYDETAKDSQWTAVMCHAIAALYEPFGQDVYARMLESLKNAVYNVSVKTMNTKIKYTLELKLPSGKVMTLDGNTVGILINYVMSYLLEFTTERPAAVHSEVTTEACFAKWGHIVQHGVWHELAGFYVRLARPRDTVVGATGQGDDATVITRCEIGTAFECARYFCQFKENCYALDERPAEFCHHFMWMKGPNAGSCCYDFTRLFHKLMTAHWRPLMPKGTCPVQEIVTRQEAIAAMMVGATSAQSIGLAADMIARALRHKEKRADLQCSINVWTVKAMIKNLIGFTNISTRVIKATARVQYVVAPERATGL